MAVGRPLDNQTTIRITRASLATILGQDTHHQAVDTWDLTGIRPTFSTNQKLKMITEPKIFISTKDSTVQWLYHPELKKNLQDKKQVLMLNHHPTLETFQ